ncbi:MAG TPA: winged helix-turn-helix domain-containing protein [Acetobacteraceae bacterium]|nr:winged helix-turn-helix domain-containing protein [Acetobacteraceae bacterium]
MSRQRNAAGTIPAPTRVAPARTAPARARAAPAASLHDRLEGGAVANLIGREAELGRLLALLAGDAPLVAHVHGPSGIGKSALLGAFGVLARQCGAGFALLDGNRVEPTERGFLAELAEALGGGAPHLPAVAARLAGKPGRTIIAVDGYELLPLLDAWLRGVLLPALPGSARLVLAGRLPPAPPWTEQPAWRGLFASVPLGPLPDAAALALLSRFGLAGEAARRTLRVTGGHPLALTLAGAQAAATPAGADFLPAATHELAQRCLGDSGDAQAREALRAAAVLRRVTVPLLRAVLPDAPAERLYERLASLPFVTRGRDGLVVQEAVREAIAAELAAADPEAHRARRQAAWRELNQAVRRAPAAALWGYTADLIYLLANPVVREAFFPRHVGRFSVEPASPAERAVLLDLARLHEPDAAVAALDLWWAEAPDAFFTVHAPPDPAPTGFCCLFDPARVPGEALRQDPLTRRWMAHLGERPVPDGQSVLFVRRWLARTEGEAPSSVQAACWLDIKRHYMALRPRLRRVYLPLRDPAPYATAARTLGFTLLDGAVAFDGAEYASAMLDMGPASVDGWLSALLAAELGMREDGVVDHAARALRIAGRQVKLTRREFELMRYLESRAAPVSRDALIHDVWGLRYDVGSNVVDAVVASLRRKLGPLAGAIETVRGYGYAYRPVGEERAEG